MAEAEAHRFLEPDFLARLDKLHLVAKRLNWGMARGEHPTVRKGYSLEFSDYRKYSRGDDLRYVDWNVYGRLERLLLKVFTAEEEITVYLLLDTSLSMAEGSPPKLEFAKNVAAALGYIGLKTHDRVGAVGLAEDVTAQLPPARSRRQVLALFNFLAELACAGRTNLETSVKTFTRRYPRPGLVVLFSDLLDGAGCRAALEELARKRHEVLLVHVLKEGEARLDPGGDVSLVDVETDRERRGVFRPRPPGARPPAGSGGSFSTATWRTGSSARWRSISPAPSDSVKAGRWTTGAPPATSPSTTSSCATSCRKQDNPPCCGSFPRLFSFCWGPSRSSCCSTA